MISVFVVPKEERKPGQSFRHGPSVSSAITLPHATCVTSELIKPALQMAEKAYHKSISEHKTQLLEAGVMLSGIVPDTTLQGGQFVYTCLRQQCAHAYGRHGQYQFQHETIF